MGRKGRKLVFKIRYRKPKKVFGTKLSLSKDGSKRLKGRVLSVTKVGYDELWRVGDHLPFNPEALLKELQATGIEREVISKCQGNQKQ